MMRPPWGIGALVMSILSLVLQIAGFNWDAWILPPPSPTQPNLTHSLEELLSLRGSYDLQKGALFEAARITLTTSLAVFVTALCVIFMHVVRCIRWPGRGLVFFVFCTLLGVALLVTSLVISLVEERRWRTNHGGGHTLNVSWGFYVEWTTVGTYTLSAGLGALERWLPRPADSDQRAIINNADQGVYGGD